MLIPRNAPVLGALAGLGLLAASVAPTFAQQAQTPPPAQQATPAPVTHQQMDQMMDAMGDGGSQRMHELMGGGNAQQGEQLMDQCVSMMGMMQQMQGTMGTSGAQGMGSLGMSGMMGSQGMGGQANQPASGPMNPAMGASDPAE